MKCRECGNEIQGSIKFCQRCGTPVVQQGVASFPVNENGGNKAYKASKKKGLTGGIKALIAVVIVFAIAAGGLAGYYFLFYKNKDTKEALEKKLGKLTDKDVVEMYYDDFNNDNTKEMFAVVGKGDKDDFADGEIWFVSADADSCIMEDIEGSVNGIIEEDDYKYISVEVFDNENDTSASYIYGVEEKDEYYEPEISGKYQNVHMDGDEIVCTDEYGENERISVRTKMPEAKTDDTTKKTKESTTKQSTTKKDTKVDESQWRSAYKKYLSDMITNSSDNLSAAMFTFAYIDADDIPEVLISTGDFHMAQVTILTYYNGKVVNLGDYGTWGLLNGYLEKSGVFYSGGGNSGYYSETCYELKNGKANVVWEGSSNANNPAGVEYVSNGKTVSETEYGNEKRKHFDENASNAKINAGRNGTMLTKENVDKIDTMTIK